MIFSGVIIASLIASTDAFSSSSVHHRRGIDAPSTKLYSYLDSLNGSIVEPNPLPSSGGSYLDSLNGGFNGDYSTSSNGAYNMQSQPSTFGQMVVSSSSIDNDGGGMTDLCAFNAASSSISSQLASSGSISAEDIHEQIKLANEVVTLTRQHFPGALGSSEILRRVKNVLDGMNIENILLTQSGTYSCIFIKI